MTAQRIDLNLLLVFEAVMATRSTTLAAADLGLTQSAVSNALNRLRGALDDPLFVRIAQGMAPTPRATEISAPLLAALEQIRATLGHHPPFDPLTSTRCFRIYMSDVGQMVMLPPLLDTLASQAPGVTVETVAPAPAKFRETTMSCGEVDLAIGYFEEFAGPFHIQALFSERYVCLVRAGHPRVVDALPLELYLTLEHAVYSPRGGGHTLQEKAIEDAFAARGLARRVRLQAAHFLGFTRIVAGSDVVTTLPSRLARVSASMTPVKILPAPIEIPAFQINQLWHRRYHQDPGNRWLRRLVAGLFGEHDVGATGPNERRRETASDSPNHALLADSLGVAHPLA